MVGLCGELMELWRAEELQRNGSRDVSDLSKSLASTLECIPLSSECCLLLPLIVEVTQLTVSVTALLIQKLASLLYNKGGTQH